MEPKTQQSGFSAELSQKNSNLKLVYHILAYDTRLFAFPPSSHIIFRRQTGNKNRKF